MRKFLLWFLTGGVLMTMAFTQDSRTIVFFGDSITQQASKPNGFIDLLQKDLPATGNNHITLVNAGIGGNKITDLFFRFQKDVLDQHPDQVVVYVGINDVWHRDQGTGTDLNKFIVFYKEMIRQLQERDISVLICTPSVIGEKTDYSNRHDGNLNAFANAIRELAAEMKCDLLDLRKEFIQYEVAHNVENREKGILTGDGVHLNDKGNHFVYTLLKEKLAL